MTIFLWLLSHVVCLFLGWCAALIWPGIRDDDDQADDADASGSQWIAQPRMAAKAKLAALLDKSGKLPKVTDWAKFDKSCQLNKFGPAVLQKDWAYKDRKDREAENP